MSTDRPDISVVLPSYHGSAEAFRSASRVREVLQSSHPGRWEIVVVDDGGGDFPVDAWDSDHRIRLLSLSPSQGKGAAVKAGVLAATGRVRVYTDGLDVLGIKVRSVRGQYECAPLQELIHREFLIRLEKVGPDPDGSPSGP